MRTRKLKKKRQKAGQARGVSAPRPAPRPAPSLASNTPGMITTVAGNGVAAFRGDGGLASSASLNLPYGLAVDRNNNIFIADTFNNRIRRVDALTGIITTFAGNGTKGFGGDGGLAINAVLNNPRGITQDTTGNILIADSLNNRIRQVDLGTRVIRTIVGNGSCGSRGGGDYGPGTSAYLCDPYGVVVDNSRNVYIAETRSRQIRKRAVGTGAMETVMWFDYHRSSSENRMIMGRPYGIAADRNGNIFITETDNNSVIRFDTYGAITTVAGNQVAAFRGDEGLATSASLNQPHGIAVDRNGNIFIADTFNHRIRRVDAITGVITTVAGDGNQGFRGDGGSAMMASFRFPRAVAIDNSGNLFIADEGNHRIRKVNGPFR